MNFFQMTLGEFALSLLCLALICIPGFSSRADSRSYTVVPKSSTFFISLNSATRDDALVACKNSGKVLASFNRTDSYQVFAPAGSVVWIMGYAGLGADSSADTKQPALMFVKSPVNDDIIQSYPTLLDRNIKHPYVCQAIN